MITEGAFRVWLQSKPPQEIVGIARHAAEDPICRWFWEEEGVRILTSASKLFIAGRFEPTPEWASRFLRYADSSKRNGERVTEISADWALFLLSEACRDPIKVQPNAIPDRLPVALRAGTRINHDVAIPVYVGTVLHGYIDPKAGMYQGGGERGNFVYHNRQAVTIALPVWRAILAHRDAIRTIEMVDHERVEVYRCNRQDAEDQGFRYLDPKVGQRYGIPVTLFTISGPDPDER